jgi:N-dimethylarginine dimethylaminohydrolase
MDKLRYLVTFGPADQETADDIGYWPSGIKAENIGLGNPAMAESAENGWKGDIDIRRREQAAFIQALIENGVPTIELPYMTPDALRAAGVTYDIEFLRDHCMARASDSRVLMFNMGTPHRKPETPVIKAIYEAMGLSTVDMSGLKHEGGNIVRLFMPGDMPDWVFSGTSQRSDWTSVREAFRFMEPDIDRNNQVSIGVQRGKALHTDCIFKPTVAVVGGQVKVTFIAHPQGMSRNSWARAERARCHLGAEVIEIDRATADAMATNGVIHEGKLINPALVGPEQALLESRLAGFTHVPSTQTVSVGGAFHCLTQEHWYNDPLDEDSLNERVLALGLFPKGARVKIHNNYGE